jgi:hypothetical protein
MERIMGWITQPYYEKGVAEGKAKVFARFLEKRFGEIPVSLRQRIFSADVETIDAWVERAFEAPNLKAVFEAH